MGLRLVLVVVLGMGKTTVTPTIVEDLVRTELYDLNEDLIAGKLDILGLARS